MQKISAKGTEYINCNLCGADDSAVLYKIPVREDQVGTYGQDVWDIVQCQQCHLLYTNPRLDADALTVYYTFENSVDYQYIQNWFIDNADLQRPTWQRFLGAMSRYGSPGRLLDVGCGAGSFLVEARKAGYEVAGLEIAPYFVQYCRTEHHLEIYEGQIEEVALERGTFDYITAFDVIEHHPDPKKLAQEMHKVLKPGGFAVISTHDIGNFYARRYGPRWRQINPIGHLTYFTRQTLSALLTSCGFEVLHIGGIHTIDRSNMTERRNWLIQFWRVIVLRSLVIGIYKPLTTRIPALTRWQLKIGDGVLTHQKLLMRAGNQIIMDDDMVLIATKKS